MYLKLPLLLNVNLVYIMVEKQLVEIEVREKVLYASYKAFDEYGNIVIEKCNFFFNNIQNINNLDDWIYKQDVNNGKSLIIETVERKKNVNEWVKFLLFNVKCLNTFFIKQFDYRLRN